MTESHTVLGWRLPAALALFVVAIACPILGSVILASDLGAEFKAAAGLLFFPIPELFDLSAIALLGKPGFAWLKSKLAGWLRPFAPLSRVSVTRYRVGLAMFLLPLLLGWLQPYLSGLVPGLDRHSLGVSLGGDLLFIGSFFVLGGEFWDKLRALFVHGATARFPESETNAGKGREGGETSGEVWTGTGTDEDKTGGD